MNMNRAKKHKNPFPRHFHIFVLAAFLFNLILICLIEKFIPTGSGPENPHITAHMVSRKSFDDMVESRRLFFLGRQSFDRKDFNNAFRHYDEAIKLEPENRFFRLGKSVSLAHMGRLSEAEAELNHLKEKHPRRPEGYFGMAMVKAKQEKYGEALDEINEALSFDPGNPQYLSDRGFIKINLDNPAEAEEDFLKALKGDPHNPYANYGMGDVSRMKSRLEEGARYYEKALEIDRELPKIHQYLASIYFDQDRFAESLEMYERELEKIEKTGRLDLFHGGACYAEMARIHAMLDNQEKAEEYMRIFHDKVSIYDLMETDTKEARSLLSDAGNAYIEMGRYNREYYKKALDFYKNCLEFESKYSGADNLYHYFQCGWCLWEMDRKTEAMEYFLRARSFAPEYMGRYEYWMLGHIALLLGEYEKAVELLSRSVEIDSTFENPRFSRGFAYYLLGRNEEALNDLKTVEELRKKGECVLIFYRKSLIVKEFIRKGISPNPESLYKI